MSSEAPSAEKVIEVFNDAGEKIGTVSDAALKASGEGSATLEVFKEGISEFFAEMKSLGAEYGPELMDTVFTMIQLYGAFEIFSTVLIAGLFFGVLTFIRAGFLAEGIKDENGKINEKAGEGISTLYMIVCFFRWALPALIIGTGLTDIFIWLALVYPEAALAYKVLGNLIGF